MRFAPAERGTLGDFAAAGEPPVFGAVVGAAPGVPEALCAMAGEAARRVAAMKATNGRMFLLSGVLPLENARLLPIG